MPPSLIAPCTLRLRALGGAALLEDDRGALLQRKRLALLVLLAAADACGRAVPRDRLLALLWPESDAESARHSLKQAVYALRGRLGDRAIHTGPDALRLDGAVVASDLADFRRALAAGDDAAAVAHYGGPFLDGAHLGGAEFAQWVDAERADLARQCGRALGALGGRARAAGLLQEAVGWYRQLAALDPLHVAHTRTLIAALADAGDVAGALRHARVHERLLREQLDLPADPSIQALAVELRTRATALPAPPPAPPAAQPAAPAAPARAGPDQATAGTDVAAPALAGTEMPPPHPRGGAQSAAPTADPAPASHAQEYPTGERGEGGPATVHTRWRGPLVLAAAGLMAALMAVLGHSATPSASPHTGASPWVAVLPFRTAGASPGLGYLREGAADLVAAHLSGDVGPRAITVHAAAEAWGRRAPADGGEASDSDALAVAREAGADQVVVGTVIGGPGRVILSAALLDAADGRSRALARVAGQVDSLPWLAEQLVVGLLAQAAGEPDGRLASLAAAVPAAARAYLAGRAAVRANQRPEAATAFRRALELDSTFALAALGLASTGAFQPAAPTPGERAALARVWGLRARLSVADQALFAGYAGERLLVPRTAAEELAHWEAATQVAPYAPETWYEFGDRLFHVGALVGAQAPRERAAAAFARALALDPAYAPALAHLAELAVLAGDTAAVRRSAGTRPRTDALLGDVTEYVRWREAVLLGDVSARRALLARLPRLGDAVLRRMVAFGQMDGTPMDDVERAAAELRQRSITSAAWVVNGTLLRQLALNRGRRPPEDVPGLPPSVEREPDAVRVLLEALYWDGGRVEARAAAAGLARRSATGGPASVELSAGARCVLALWYLAEGTAEPARVALADPAVAAADGLDPAGDVRTCHAALAAEFAVRERRPDAAAAVAQLDSLSRLGRQSPAAAWVNLALARLLEVRGDAPKALAALRRRAYDWDVGPAYLSTSLREEARLAALVGDARGAAGARQRYAALRDPRASGVGGRP